MTKKCWTNQSCFMISSASKNLFVVGKLESDGLSGSLFEWSQRKKGKSLFCTTSTSGTSSVGHGGLDP